MEIGKVTPHTEELELEVLATIMQNPEVFANVQDIFSPELFYHEDKKSMANAIIYIKRKGAALDSVQVSHELKTMGRLEEIGGIPWVASVARRFGNPVNIEHNCMVLLQYAMLRRIIFEGSGIVNSAFNPRNDVFKIIAQIEKLISDLNRGVVSDKVYTSKDLAMETAKIIQMRSEMDGIIGIPTGFEDIDKGTGGWEDGTMVVLAARPGMGKTAAMLQFATYPAMVDQTPVGIFSIEMPRTQIYMRMMSQVSDVSINKISGKSSIKMNQYDIDDLHVKCKFLYEAPIFIDDTPALSLKAFKSKARKMVSKDKVQVIFVDYLQLMDAETNASREQQVSKISSTIKATAKELNIPIIVISSLSRSVETRGNDKRPQLSDLRDSGAIESDADMVIFLYRPEYYKIDDFDGESTKGLALFTIAKHRGGELGDVKLRWDGYKTKFSNYNAGFFDEPLPKIEPNPLF